MEDEKTTKLMVVLANGDAMALNLFGPIDEATMDSLKAHFVKGKKFVYPSGAIDFSKCVAFSVNRGE